MTYLFQQSCTLHREYFIINFYFSQKWVVSIYTFCFYLFKCISCHYVQVRGILFKSMFNSLILHKIFFHSVLFYRWWRLLVWTPVWRVHLGSFRFIQAIPSHYISVHSKSCRIWQQMSTKPLSHRSPPFLMFFSFRLLQGYCPINSFIVQNIVIKILYGWSVCLTLSAKDIHFSN